MSRSARDSFDTWVDRYGRAWEKRDAQSFSDLFTTDARYYWTPFEEPKLGREGIARAFEAATDNQQDIRFEYELLSVEAPVRLARWRCEFTRIGTGVRVHLDGILSVRMAENGLCQEFREWWHSDET